MSDWQREILEEDLRRDKGGWEPMQPVCQCTPDTYWEPGSICGFCEERLEREQNEIGSGR